MGRERFNAVEFFPDPPEGMGLVSRWVVPPLRVVEGANQYFKQLHEYSFHASNANGQVPEKSENQYVRSFW